MLCHIPHALSTALNACTFEALARSAINVMDDENIASAHIAGVSLGTIVNDAFSILAPDRIKTMTLSGVVQI